MNCESFEAITSDLAKNSLIDAEQRAAAQSHAASCARCEMRLTDERELTAGLKELALVWNEEAPTRVEASVLALFKEQRTASAAFASSTRATNRWLYIAAGFAALIVIALILSLTISRTRDSVEQPKPDRQAKAAAPDEPRETGRESNPPAGTSQRDAVRAAANGRSVKPAGKQDHAPRHGINPPDDSRDDAEIATEFFPLMGREGLRQLDSAQVVRVELPRSAMMSFGLPVNMDRADQRIKADVVVGNDGMARAIRFVR